MVPLQELVLELTDWCPLTCRHCSSDSGPNCRNRLEPELALRLVGEAAELGATKLSLGGGEPTASPHFLPVLRRVMQVPMRAEVFTCGVALGEGSITPLGKALVGSLAEVKGLKVIFSIHGPDAALHDAITQVAGSFACLSASLDACLAAGIDCEANFVPLRPNFASFGEVVRLAEERGLRRVSVLRFVPQGRGLAQRSALQLTGQEEARFVKEILRIRRTSSVAIRTGSPFNGIVPGSMVRCRAGSEKLVVQADGNILPCEVFKHADRRRWELSAYHVSVRGALSSRQFAGLRRRLKETTCFRCPVHSALRGEQARGSRHGQEAGAVVPG